MCNKSVTTASLHTPPGVGGIAVIVLAGPQAEELLAEVFEPLSSHAHGGEGVLQLGRLKAGDEVIDEAIVHRGANLVEINIHGGPQVTRAAMQRLAECGANPTQPDADAGVFCPAHPDHCNPAIGRELLAALPSARTEAVVAALSQQWSAGLSKPARRALSPQRSDETSSQLRLAARRLGLMQRLLDPPEVVLIGPPNVGKSMLMNALVGRRVSIVHETPGTTRDWVRELADFNGLPVWLTDTAGIWDVGGVDAEAVRRARHRAENADLVLLISAGEPSVAPNWLGAGDLFRIQAKCDIIEPPEAGEAIGVSAVTGEGLDALTAAVLREFDLDEFDPAAPMAFTQRQSDLLNRAADAFDADDATAAEAALASLLEGELTA